MQINQIAHLLKTDEAELALRHSLGLQNAKWTEDVITANTMTLIDDQWKIGVGVTHVKFNFDLGIEYETIRVIRGDHFHNKELEDGGLLSAHPAQSVFSHFGLRLEQWENFPTTELPKPWRKVYQADTTSHTNPFITSRNRKYRLDAWQCGEARDFRVYIKRMEGSE